MVVTALFVIIRETFADMFTEDYTGNTDIGIA